MARLLYQKVASFAIVIAAVGILRNIVNYSGISLQRRRKGHNET